MQDSSGLRRLIVVEGARERMFDTLAALSKVLDWKAALGQKSSRQGFSAGSLPRPPTLSTSIPRFERQTPTPATSDEGVM